MAEPTAPLTTTTLTTTNNTDEAPLMTTPATPVTAAMQMAQLDGGRTGSQGRGGRLPSHVAADVSHVTAVYCNRLQ